MKSKLRTYLKFPILILLAVLLLWFFGRGLDWQQVRQGLEKADKLHLIFATLLICLGYLLRALRWRTLLSPITETSVRELFATTTVGFAAVFLIGRAGEIVRPMWLPMRDKRVRPSAALVTLGVERICDLAALAGIFALNLIWFETPAGREAEFAYVRWAGMLMLSAVCAGIIFLFFFHRFSAAITYWIEKQISRVSFFPRRLRRVVLSILKQLAASLEIFRDWKEVIGVVLWSIALWGSIALPTWFVIRAFGLDFSFSESLFVMGWAAIGSIVPTPGGAAGAFHAVTAQGLGFLNVERDLAAAISIALHLVYFAPAIFFGAYYFLRGDLSLTRLKEMLLSEHPIEDAATGAEPSA